MKRNETFNWQGLYANNVLLRSRICAVSCQSNSTAVCRVVHYIETEALRIVTDRMCAVARNYGIFSKADRGDIFIVHDQKSSYCTPLTGTQQKTCNLGEAPT